MIDLYSDTVTRPTLEMRQAMLQATVGDEQRGEDPTTNALQDYVARQLDKEASLFLPSATMANAIACRLHTHMGEAIICEAHCHILNSETGGLAVHSGIVPRLVNGDRGHFTPEQVEEQLTLSGHYRPLTTLLACEQTHNAAGGTIWPLKQLQAVCKVAHDNGLKTHLDGARLLNACAARGVPAADYSAPFDTVMLCLSKGLGCPMGALLAGRAADIARARTLKQQFGGSMRQSGILAAAGLYALEHNVERLTQDHDNARRLAAGLAQSPGLEVEMPIETNMVFVNVQRTGMNAAEIASRLRQAGVGCSQSETYRLRFVTHLEVGAEDIEHAIARARQAIG
ncbi:L-allo-threonine aldolase [Candidatus Entotheonellaceae bacterium PAL068K]